MFSGSYHESVTILGDLVHNETVLSELRAQGIKIAQEAGAVPALGAGAGAPDFQ